MGERIRQAKITEQAVPLRTVIADQEDYYESIWQDVRIRGWVRTTGTSADIDRIWGEAEDLFHARCTRCHALHRPTEFKANQWPSILKIMTIRAGLSGDQKALVTRYLQIHAKGRGGASEQGALASTQADQGKWQPPKPLVVGDAKFAAKGAAAFQSRSCFACHGADARTPVMPSYPALAGQRADYLFKQMKDFKNGLRANDEFKMMQQTLEQIPEGEMRAIAYWLSTL